MGIASVLEIQTLYLTIRPPTVHWVITAMIGRNMTGGSVRSSVIFLRLRCMVMPEQSDTVQANPIHLSL